MKFVDNYDAIVIGSGHAGSEACLALSRLGKKTLLTTLNLDSIAFLACNPSIGGTAKGQLAGEIDALGGEMGYAADLHRDALIATGVVLFIFIMIINLLFSLIKLKRNT